MMKRGDEGRWEGAHRPRKRRRHVARMGAHARPRAAWAPSLIHPACVLLLDRGFAQGSGRGLGGQAKPLHSFRLVLVPQGRAGGGGRGAAGKGRAPALCAPTARAACSPGDGTPICCPSASCHSWRAPFLQRAREGEAEDRSPPKGGRRGPRGPGAHSWSAVAAGGARGAARCRRLGRQSSAPTPRTRILMPETA